MIIKSYEINKYKDKSNYYLFYGKNEGLKNECIDEITINKQNKIFNYDEKQIQDDKETFFENILSISLF
jgi:DNA polymerase-3 subunit delta